LWLSTKGRRFEAVQPSGIEASAHGLDTLTVNVHLEDQPDYLSLRLFYFQTPVFSSIAILYLVASGNLATLQLSSTPHYHALSDVINFDFAQCCFDTHSPPLPMICALSRALSRSASSAARSGLRSSHATRRQ
jgi:hypothetical protein